MKQKTRTDFREYCLRRLGKPLIDINVSAEQVDDRIDDALDMFKERHFDSMEEKYLIKYINYDEIQQGFIVLPEVVVGVVQLFPMNTEAMTGDMFDVTYQMNLNDYLNKEGIYSSSGGMSSYYIYKLNMATMRWLLTPEDRFEFNKKTHRLFLYNDLSSAYTADRPVVIRCYMNIGEHENIWSDPWLRDYTTQLIKRQWGENLKKYGSITLPSGMTLNGDQMYTEAAAEIQRLEDKLLTDYELPSDFFMG
jgi:hypothetical protein